MVPVSPSARPLLLQITVEFKNHRRPIHWCQIQILCILTETKLCRLFLIQQFLTTSFQSCHAWDISTPSLAYDKLSLRRIASTTICPDHDLIVQQFVTTTIFHHDNLSRPWLDDTTSYSDSHTLRFFAQRSGAPLCFMSPPVIALLNRSQTWTYTAQNIRKWGYRGQNIEKLMDDYYVCSHSTKAATYKFSIRISLV